MEKGIYVYREDDWIARVNLLQDLSDDEYYRYELKVMRTLKESKIYKPTEDGTIFQCSCLKTHSSTWGGWSLRKP